MGTRIGIYDVLYECEERTKCNHKLYHIKCTECGHEFDMMKSDIGRAQECKHRGILSQEEIDKWYEKNKRRCLFCGQFIPLGDLSFNEYKERKFCSNSCAASYNNKQRPITKIKKEKRLNSKKYCKNCGKEIPSNKTYCSQQCLSEFRQKDYIEKWKTD